MLKHLTFTPRINMFKITQKHTMTMTQIGAVTKREIDQTLTIIHLLSFKIRIYTHTGYIYVYTLGVSDSEPKKKTVD